MNDLEGIIKRLKERKVKARKSSLINVFESLVKLTHVYSTKRNATFNLYNHNMKIKILANKSTEMYVSPGENFLVEIKNLLDNCENNSLQICKLYIQRFITLLNCKVHDLWRIDSEIENYSSFHVAIFTSYCLLNEMNRLADLIEVFHSKTANLSDIRTYRSMRRSSCTTIKLLKAYISDRTNDYTKNIISNVIKNKKQLYNKCRHNHYISIGNVLIKNIISPITTLLNKDFNVMTDKLKIKSFLYCINILHNNSLLTYFFVVKDTKIRIDLYGIFNIYNESKLLYQNIISLKLLDILKSYNDKIIFDITTYKYIESVLKFCIMLIYININKNLLHNNNKIYDYTNLFYESENSPNTNNDLFILSDSEKIIWKSKLVFYNFFTNIFNKKKINKIIQNNKIFFDFNQ